ncbi:MAG: ATP-binding cassette domain-containing protein [Simkaniaceae bacterium]|nr:ATP-binding cassette domain-containing protein [Simkaniaceae bacterium]
MINHPLLEVRDLCVDYPHSKTDIVKAVRHAGFTIYEGEVLGLVGESGCGKSTLAKTLVRILHPTSGSIHYDGINLLHPTKEEHFKLCREIQLVFQNTSSSLNPRMTIQEILTEPHLIHRNASSFHATQSQMIRLLNLVGLRSEVLGRYPHEISGGQRQRICIARALALSPRFIIFDESISALDVSVQAQIINLLIELRQKINLTFLFISHDLSMMKFLTTRIAVMYQGHIVEMAPTQELYQNPVHPYTKQLIAAIPIPDPLKERERHAPLVMKS